MSTQVETLYFVHREQVRHSLSVLKKIAEQAATKGEHPDVQAGGKQALEACENADQELREADKHFRAIGLERKEAIK